MVLLPALPPSASAKDLHRADVPVIRTNGCGGVGTRSVAGVRSRSYRIVQPRGKALHGSRSAPGLTGRAAVALAPSASPGAARATGAPGDAALPPDDPAGRQSHQAAAAPHEPVAPPAPLPQLPLL